MGSFDDFPFQSYTSDIDAESMCDGSASQEGMFCNYEQGGVGTFEPCEKHASVASCHNDGLPPDGITDCVTTCFPSIAFTPDIQNGVCAVVITINTAEFGEEISFSVDGGFEQSGPQGQPLTPFGTDQTYTFQIGLAPGAHTFFASDQFGDGWNGGTYSIAMADGSGVIPVTDFTYGWEQETEFTIACSTEVEDTPTMPPTPHPTMATCSTEDGGITGTGCDGITAFCGHEAGKDPECYCFPGYHHGDGDAASDHPTSCVTNLMPTVAPTKGPTRVVLEGVAAQYPFKVVMAEGWYPSEMRWRVDGGGVHTFYSSEHMTLDMPPGSHTLFMEDTFGDGWNDGQWELQVEGHTVAGPFTCADGFTAEAEFDISPFDGGIPAPPNELVSPASPCGCEVDGESFCNFDMGTTGFCEPCSRHTELASCNDDGLPLAGAIDCTARCFANGESAGSSGSYAGAGSFGGDVSMGAGSGNGSGSYGLLMNEDGDATKSEFHFDELVFGSALRAKHESQEVRSSKVGVTVIGASMVAVGAVVVIAAFFIVKRKEAMAHPRLATPTFTPAAESV
jgi:hypothetical protein